MARRMINMRMEDEDRTLVERAVEIAGATRTNWMCRTLVAEARRVIGRQMIADQRRLEAQQQRAGGRKS